MLTRIILLVSYLLKPRVDVPHTRGTIATIATMLHLFFDHAIIVSGTDVLFQLSHPEDFDVDSNYSFQTLLVSVLVRSFSVQ